MAKRKKPKQGHLDGMAPPSIKEVDAAAEDYDETMRRRVKLSKEEDEAKTALIEVMKTHNLAQYTTPDGLLVLVTNKSGIKVKRIEEDAGEEEAAEE